MARLVRFARLARLGEFGYATAPAEIVETLILPSCAAFAHTFAILACYVSYHMYDNVRTFGIFKINHSQQI